METQWLPVSLVVWITALAGVLDARQQARFVQLCTGLLFARGRRTVTSWLRGCAVGRDYKRYYYLLGSVGRKTLPIAAALLRILLRKIPGDAPGAPLVFAIDDSPTKRYGPHVEGAGKHHNPTPGPCMDRGHRMIREIRQHMVQVMMSFLAGLFVGEGKFEEIKDNRERSISFGSRGDPCCRRKCLLFKMVPASRLVVRT